jgi:hypothetical protein
VLLLLLVASYSTAAAAAGPGYSRNNDDNMMLKVQAELEQRRHERAIVDSYIVTLTAEPLAAYSGSINGLAATASTEGEKLDVTSAAAVAYVAHVDAQSAAVAAQAGVQPSRIGYRYRVTLAGFTVRNPSRSELAALRRSPIVARVEQNAMVHSMTDASIRFMGLAGEKLDFTGMWYLSTYGGVCGGASTACGLEMFQTYIVCLVRPSMPSVLVHAVTQNTKVLSISEGPTA